MTDSLGTLTGYAYETIPNKLIIAGKTKGPDDARAEESSASRLPKPESVTLGALAAGSRRPSIWQPKERDEGTK